ncbi:hypothetical protein MHF_1130 [Mycoplasma haemofelis Ohio2]|uniref:Uncharacterized protein n=1 Tax=Mycoplasma haemofelis (strain Ohio2) TaxID=859194 RepID=F6FJL8_MYCHI|nr:hypothetical protein MHF_1130 [Mycoplasma haemofelis Ohio2]
MKLLPYSALLGLGAIGIGGWYRFGNLQPKTLRQYLEWQGLRLISDSESNYWKAVIEENKELVKRLNLDESKVKEWCRNHLDLEKYEDVKDSALLLCVDNPKSVKARIIQLDGGIHKLINGSGADKQYKVAYVFRKHIDGFNSLIGYSPEKDEKGKEQIDLAQAKDAFQTWCENSLTKPVEETLVLNIREMCAPKTFSKVKEYLSGRTLLTQSDKTSQLQAVYEKIKDFATYKEDIKSIRESEKDGLKKWCEQNLEKEFSDDLSVFEETLPKVISRCVEGSVTVDS